MATKITVKDAKACLRALLEKLNKFDDSDEFFAEFDDNNGGYYSGELANFDVSKSADGAVHFTNY